MHRRPATDRRRRANDAAGILARLARMFRESQSDHRTQYEIARVVSPRIFAGDHANPGRDKVIADRLDAASEAVLLLGYPPEELEAANASALRVADAAGIELERLYPAIEPVPGSERIRITLQLDPEQRAGDPASRRREVLLSATLAYPVKSSEGEPS